MQKLCSTCCKSTHDAAATKKWPLVTLVTGLVATGDKLLKKFNIFCYLGCKNRTAHTKQKKKAGSKKKAEYK